MCARGEGRGAREEVENVALLEVQTSTSTRPEKHQGEMGRLVYIYVAHLPVSAAGRDVGHVDRASRRRESQRDGPLLLVDRPTESGAARKV